MHGQQNIKKTDILILSQIVPINNDGIKISSTNFKLWGRPAPEVRVGLTILCF